MSQLTLRRRKEEEEEEEAPISFFPLPPLVYYLLRPSFPRRGANEKKEAKVRKRGRKLVKRRVGHIAVKRFFQRARKSSPLPTDTCACTLFLQVVEFSGTDRKLSYYVHSNFIIIFLCSLVRLHAQSNVVVALEKRTPCPPAHSRKTSPPPSPQQPLLSSRIDFPSSSSSAHSCNLASPPPLSPSSTQIYAIPPFLSLFSTAFSSFFVPGLSPLRFLAKIEGDQGEGEAYSSFPPFFGEGCFLFFALPVQEGGVGVRLSWNTILYSDTLG